MHSRHACLLGTLGGVLALGIACSSANPPSGAVDTAPRAARAAVPGAPAGVTAFTNVAVLPMDTDRVLTDQTVLVQGGRVTALGPAAKVRVPSSATRIDGRGQFLIPGLTEMHAHLFHDIHGDPSNANIMGDTVRALRRLALLLANGVTTVRNMDNAFTPNNAPSIRLKARAASGELLAPRIYTGGVWGIAPLQHQWPEPGEVARYVQAYKDAGFDFVKSYYEPGPIYDSVVAVARRIGIPIEGHVPPETSFDQALATMKSMEHPMTEWYKDVTVVNPDTAKLRTLAARMRAAGVWNCPTQSHYVMRHGFPVGNGVVKALQAGGVGLLLGTDDPPRAGLMARELQALVAEGLTPYQALVAGTRNPAVFFGTLHETGTIAVGKRADLVLLPGNPLTDVRYTAQPSGVMLGGRWLTKEALTQHVAAASGGQPMRTYWANVADEAGEPNLMGFGIDQSQQANVAKLDSAYLVHRSALVDSLGTSTQYAAGERRVFQLLADVLGAARGVLTPAQQSQFDQVARSWMQQRAAEGRPIKIPGE